MFTSAAVQPNETALLSSAVKGQCPEVKDPRKGDDCSGNIFMHINNYVAGCRRSIVLVRIAECHSRHSITTTTVFALNAAGVERSHSLTFPRKAVRGITDWRWTILTPLNLSGAAIAGISTAANGLRDLSFSAWRTGLDLG